MLIVTCQLGKLEGANTVKFISCCSNKDIAEGTLIEINDLNATLNESNTLQ